MDTAKRRLNWRSKKVLRIPLVLLLALVVVCTGFPLAGPAPAYGAVGGTFFSSDGVEYMILSESGATGTVQVGYSTDAWGGRPAIDTDRSGTINLPPTVSDGVRTYDVVKIGEDAFNGCAELTSVIIPDSVTSIENWAFYDCSKLTSVTISGSVTSIGEEAFAECVSLANVAIPASVKSIGYEAFAACTSLVSITFARVRPPVFDWNVFYDDNALSRINVPAESIDGYKIALESAGLCILEDGAGFRIAEPFVVPGTPDITYIILTEGSGGRNGTVQVGKNPEDGWGTPAIDPSWSGNLVLPETVVHPTDGKTYTVVKIGSGAFIGCDDLTDVTIPASVISIGNNAFAFCEALTNIAIPPSVKSIGEEAFLHCTGLTSMTIPGGVTSIGNGTFQFCASLSSIAMPNGITSIGGNAFYDCSALTNMTIPASVKSIGGEAFSHCTGLTSIVIPASVKSIGGRAFQNCTGLTSMAILASVKSIGYRTFSNCTSLTSVTIPGSVISMGDYAFEKCTSLSSITIGGGVKVIGEGTFSDCTGLTAVTFGSNVDIIGYGAFLDCSNLTSITFTRAEPPIFRSEVFYGDLSISEAIVPAGSLDDYRAALKKVGLNISGIDMLQSLASVQVTVGNAVYTGSPVTPPVTVTVGGQPLVNGTDYTVSYGNNIAVGKARVTVTGKGNYTGEKTVEFSITQEETPTTTPGGITPEQTAPKPGDSIGGANSGKVAGSLTDKSGAAVALVISGLKDKAWTGGQVKPVVTVKAGSKTLKPGTDYTVTYGKNKNIGKGTLTIKGKGDYSGTNALTFKIVPKTPTGLNLAAGKKSLTVKWTKVSKAQKATGYQVQYRYKSGTKWSPWKTKTFKVSDQSKATVAKTIGKLNAKKVYQVKIRAYKKVGAVNYYSAWCKAKSKKAA